MLRPYSARVYGLDQAIDNLSELNDLEVNRPKEFLTESNTVTMPVFGLTHGVRKPGAVRPCEGGRRVCLYRGDAGRLCNGL